MVWTDPDTLKQTAGTQARSADFNAAMDNLLFLFEQPRITLRNNADQPVAHATDVTLSWPNLLGSDTWNMWDVGSPTVVVCKVKGTYLIRVRLLGEGGDTGAWHIRLQVNGTTFVGGRRARMTNPYEDSISWETALDVNDDIRIIARQTSGETRNIQAVASRSPILQVRRTVPFVEAS
jgi:hypothetical protein